MSRRTDERAESGVLGEALAIALCIGGLVVLFVYYADFTDQDAPAAIGFRDGGAPASTDHELVVVQALGGVGWSDLRVMLNGHELAYSSTLGADRTFCIRQAASCFPLLPAREVQGGDVIRVHATTLDGTTLLVRDAAANAILYAHRL